MKSLSLYIHIPWCIQKCPYCDFNSHNKKGELPEEAYIERLIDNLNEHKSLWHGRKLTSIFIGGGTPSLFHPDGIARLLDAIHNMLPLDATTEVTMEANPGTLEHYPFITLRKAGINRLSLGAQSFSPHQLKRLGRIHSKEAIASSFYEAREAGFTNINIDLMYGLIEQTTHEAMDDLVQALQLQPDHLSWYQLTIEPHTPFFRRRPQLPQEERLIEMHHEGQHLLANAKFLPYEISAYTQNKPSAHNLNYWEFGDYLGIGAGAHSKMTQQNSIVRYWNHKHPKQFLESHASISGTRTLQSSDYTIEYLMNRLRLYAPMSKDDFERHTRLQWSHFKEKIIAHDQYQWIEIDDHMMTLTNQGRLMTDEILGWFLD